MTEEKAFLKDIEKLIRKRIPVIEDHPYPLIDHHPLKAPRQQRPQRTNFARQKPEAISERKRLVRNPRFS